MNARQPATRNTQPTRRKASEIYRKQNTVIHKAMIGARMPYEANKDAWLSLATELTGRTVAGLSEMTLAERHKLINHFQKLGYRLYAPAVPVAIRDWKKSQEDVEYEFRPDDDAQVRMVEAMWQEAGYRLKTLRGLCWKLFRKDDPRWLADNELSRLVNVVRAKVQGKELGHYYRR